MSYSPLGEYVAIGSMDRYLKIYDVVTLQPIKKIHVHESVTSISWGTADNVVAIRSGKNVVSIFEIYPIQIIKQKLDLAYKKGNSLCWSYDGRFLARISDRGKNIIVSDTSSNLNDVAQSSTILVDCQSSKSNNDSKISNNNGTTLDKKNKIHNESVGQIQCIEFAKTKAHGNMIASAAVDGFVVLYKLVRSKKQFHVEIICREYVEEDLRAICWSTDGSFIACGGRERNIHFLSSSDLSKCGESIMSIGGRVTSIDFVPKLTIDHFGDEVSSLNLAVGTDSCTALLYDLNSRDQNLKIVRLRSVRSVRYHPYLPILAVGTDEHHVVIVNLIDEQVIKEVDAGGRVHSMDFSSCGAYLAVACDDGIISMYETSTFMIVQSFPHYGWGIATRFSGSSGQYLALGGRNGKLNILRMGCLLGTNFLPLCGIDNLPAWALNEAVYRSGNGPSLIQRYMRDGSQQSLRHIGIILKKHPEAIYTFDRETGEDCFDTVHSSGKSILLKHVLLTLVDGSLEDGNRSTLASLISVKGFETFLNMVASHDSDVVVAILGNMSFSKVPFNHAQYCHGDVQECGSSNFTDPWEGLHSYLGITPKETNNEKNNRRREKYRVIRTPAVLPLPSLGSLKFLSSLTSECSPNVFDNIAMGTVLRVMWWNLRTYFYLDMILFVMFYIFWGYFVDITSSTTSQNYEYYSKTKIIYFGVVILFMNTIFTYKEFRQSGFYLNKEFWREYWRSWWNLIDVLSGTMVYTHVISTLLSDGARNGYVPLAVVTTLTLTVKLLSYLRGFDSTGWLISVLTQNFYDIRGFVLILACIVTGFTISFRLLLRDVEGPCQLTISDSETYKSQVIEECMNAPYGSAPRALLSTFQLAILGAYDQELFENSNFYHFASVVFVLAVTVCLVVCLNALVAILSDSYSRVQEHATANRRKEKAELIVEYLILLPKWKRRQIEKQTRYFHALLEADADGDLLVSKDDWQGGINALRNELNTLSMITNEKTQNSITRLQSELNMDISAFRTEMITSFKKITSELDSRRQGTKERVLTYRDPNVSKAVKIVRSIGLNLPLVPNLTEAFSQGDSSHVNARSNRKFSSKASSLSNS